MCKRKLKFDIVGLDSNGASHLILMFWYSKVEDYAHCADEKVIVKRAE